MKIVDIPTIQPSHLDLCSGKIDGIERIWANGQLIDSSKIKYRLYKGDNLQDTDPLLSQEEYPVAFRDLAYIVIEDFALAEFGNKIPKLEFEIIKNHADLYPNEAPLEEKIRGITIIPGSGEFVYDTILQNSTIGTRLEGKIVSSNEYEHTLINNNTERSISDATIALDQLASTLPNIEWVSVVVSWFADSLEIDNCSIYPAIENSNNHIFTSPLEWNVAGIDRYNAREVSRDINGNPNYGGTINDQSLINFLMELKKRGYKIMLYPILLIDNIDKPWRGRITGNHSDINNFFTKEDGYNNFILHYANLTKNYIDTFCIGSELKGITQKANVDLQNIYHTDTIEFPGVKKLKELAGYVKNIVGSKVKLTYAADWSEYHSVPIRYLVEHFGFQEARYYNMDELWTSDNIDYVGIDAYFPLTDSRQPLTGFSRESIIRGWTTGENINYHYEDNENKTTRIAITNRSDAIKDIDYWWNNTHINGEIYENSGWNAGMKPIWFTEYGFPSLNGCSNQPNVFLDNSSIESKYPHLSNKDIDFSAQRIAIDATIEKWKNSNMVENMFLWTWDARPYPYFPNLQQKWSDGNNWKTGHWVQGKMSISILGSIIKNILQEVYEENQIDTSELTTLVKGFVIDNTLSIKDNLNILKKAYFFNILSRDKVIKFISINKNILPSLNISHDDITNNKVRLEIKKYNNHTAPHNIKILYINNDYEISSQDSNYAPNSIKTNIKLPIIMDSNTAKNISEITLQNIINNDIYYKFTLPLKYYTLESSDIISFNIDNSIYTTIISQIEYNKNSIEVTCIDYNHIIYQQSNAFIENYNTSQNIKNNVISNTEVEIIDTVLLPMDKGQNKIYIASYAKGNNWKGARIYQSNDGGNTYDIIGRINYESTIGYTLNNINPIESLHTIDRNNHIDIILSSGELHDTTFSGLLNYENMALLGNEIIQFQNVDKIFDEELKLYKYRLYNILRGRLNTEKYSKTLHNSGIRFILLNQHLTSINTSYHDIRTEKLYKIVSLGQSIEDVEAITIQYQGKSFEIPSVIKQNYIQSGNEVIFNWNRRSKEAFSIKDFVDLPKTYDFVKYIIQFEGTNKSYIVEVDNELENHYNLLVEDNDIITDVNISTFSSIYGPNNIQ